VTRLPSLLVPAVAAAGLGAIFNGPVAPAPLAEAQALVDLAPAGAVVTLPRAVYAAPGRGGLRLERAITLDGSGSIIRGVGFDETHGPADAGDRSALVHIAASGVHLSNLVVERAPHRGVQVEGSGNLLQEVVCRDSWSTCIAVLGGADNALIHVEAHNSRHGSGIGFGPGDEGGRGHLVLRSVSHDNGRRPDGRKVPPVPGDPAGGGNSDGMGTGKACSDDFPANACVAYRFVENLVYRNADDGLDVTVWDAEVRGNVFWDNGPEGRRGVKMLRNGTALIAGNVAVWHDVGFEARFARPGRIVHNLALHASNRGIYGTGAATAEVVGNVVFLSGGGIRCAAGCTGGTNHDDPAADPGLADAALVPALWRYDYPAPTVQARWAALYERFRQAYRPQPSSPLIDAGAVVEGYHCPEPGTGDGECVEWRGAAPDLGPFEAPLPAPR